MNYSKSRNDSNLLKPKFAKAPRPNIDNLIKKIKENDKFKIEEIIGKHYMAPNSRGSRVSNSSLSNRSGSRDAVGMSDNYGSNDESYNENYYPLNRQISVEEPMNMKPKLPVLNNNKSTRKVYSSLERDKEVPSSADVSTFEKRVLEHRIKVPTVTAKSWCVYDAITGDFIYGVREHKRREIASLTKIMTCYVVCKLIREYKVDPKTTYIQVSAMASSMNGTSANLQYGDILSIWDLLHGMMLPSGNDAAYSLAESFGTYIYLQSNEYKDKVKAYPDAANHKVKNPVKLFLDAMNKTAEDLKLTNTYYANPHGLMNQHNQSTAADVARLSTVVLKDDIIKQVVCTKKYYCEIEQDDKLNRTVAWENTNKLLDEGWDGVKTGVTTAAGPCLSACYSDGYGQQYVVVVLSSNSMDHRWGECIKLIRWIMENKKSFKM
jgi:D-alanyl-D-alanine carboxypeptidase